MSYQASPDLYHVSNEDSPGSGKARLGIGRDGGAQVVAWADEGGKKKKKKRRPKPPAEPYDPEKAYKAWVAKGVSKPGEALAIEDMEETKVAAAPGGGGKQLPNGWKAMAGGKYRNIFTGEVLESARPTRAASRIPRRSPDIADANAAAAQPS